VIMHLWIALRQAVVKMHEPKLIWVGRFLTD
jgi:hypothetical protein